MTGQSGERFVARHAQARRNVLVGAIYENCKLGSRQRRCAGGGGGGGGSGGVSDEREVKRNLSARWGQETAVLRMHHEMYTTRTLT